MPISSLNEARNEISEHFFTHWSALQFPPKIVWDDKESDPPANDDWVRFSIQHNVSDQATIGGFLSPGVRNTVRGIVTVQVFAISGDGLETADNLAEQAIRAFEGQRTEPSNIWFTNVVANEVGQSGPWFQMNVTAEFRYDRLDVRNEVESVLPWIDPFYDNTVLLARFNGADGATAYTDESAAQQGAFSFVGSSVQLDTAQKKFGSASLLNTGGGGAHRVTVPFGTDFEFDGQFTIDLWARRTSDNTDFRAMLGSGASQGTAHYVLFSQGDGAGSQTYRFQFRDTSNRVIDSTDTVAIGSWAHIAITRDASNVIRMFVNGKVQPATLTNGSTITSLDSSLDIANFINGFRWQGHIDDLRITKGVCRWTDDFNVPTVEVPTEGPS